MALKLPNHLTFHNSGEAGGIPQPGKARIVSKPQNSGLMILRRCFEKGKALISIADGRSQRRQRKEFRRRWSFVEQSPRFIRPPKPGGKFRFGKNEIRKFADSAFQLSQKRFGRFF